MSYQPKTHLLRSGVPQRLDGHRPLRHIPLDVYLETFDYFQVGESFSERECKIILSNIIPVCRLFRAICLPRRLRSLTLSSQQKGLIKFTRTKFHEPQVNLCVYVRALRIADWLPESPGLSESDIDSEYEDEIVQNIQNAWVYRGIMSRLCETLPRFQNVTELIIDHAMLGLSVFIHIPLMDSLCSVDIAHCVFDDPLTDRAYRLIYHMTPRTPWRKLRFVENTGYEKALHALATMASTSALESFTTTEWYVARAFLTHEKKALVNLKTLDIPCDEPDVIGKFLAVTPTITTLAITGLPEFTVGVQTHLQLPPSALPNLHTLNCNSVLLEELVSGRPVSNIEVFTTNCGAPIPNALSTTDILSTLSRSSAQIKNLGIEDTAPSLSDEELNLGYFAQLERLTWYPSIHEHDLTEMIKSKRLPANGVIWHPTVPTVNIVCEYYLQEALVPVYDLQAQHDLLCPFFASLFPGATTITTTPGIEWRKYMLGSPSVPVWKPVVIARDDVRSHILADPDAYTLKKDYEGCLKGLFEEDELDPLLKSVLGIEDDIEFFSEYEILLRLQKMSTVIEEDDHVDICLTGNGSGVRAPHYYCLHVLHESVASIELIIDDVEPTGDSYPNMSSIEVVTLLNVTVPERRDGSNTLQQIPADVYYDIFDYFQVGETFSGRECKTIFSNLIPVCRLFRAICLPRRLRSLTLPIQKKDLVKFTGTNFHEPYINLYAFVSALRFADRLPKPLFESDGSESEDGIAQRIQNAWVYRSIILPLCDNLPRFQNVTELTIDDTVLGLRVFTYIALMDSLCSVDIAHCVFDDTPTDRASRIIHPVTPWRKLRFVKNEWYDKAVQALATIACTPALETFITNEWHVARTFLTHEKKALVNLKMLDIPGDEPDVIGKFLAVTPTISTLTIRDGPQFATGDQAPLRLPPSALPNLHTLRCDSVLLEELVSGRPVSNVEVTNTNFGAYTPDASSTADFLSILNRSSAPIRGLGLEVFASKLTDAKGLNLRNFAQLERFTFYAADDERGFTEIIKSEDLAASKAIWHPTVSTVNIVFDYCVEPDLVLAYDLQVDHDLLCPLFEILFPGVKTITTCPGIEWRKHMHGSPSAPVWKPVVIARDDVRSHILSNADACVVTKDYEGCLKGLFEEEELNLPLKRALGIEDDG
ncbi:hypothetical protein EVG20_g7455 [Dentipellis fragilis]|uniref:Uncharacterized protein n=1 Tax=Dentipellis fragilis TaxID=205917 RepID=A0A4Y9YDR1_9AGAM|nr:hypothetical protein EVG20_g7455 [Dentipellis fragilis]